MRTASADGANHGRIWPSPSIRYLNVHSSRSPIGPRAWSFWVELPISAPIPNSPPSVNRVDALTYTQAASTPSWNARADCVSRVTIASEWPLPWALMCAIASSTESTTPTASSSARYSVSQSSSVAASIGTSGGRAARAVVAVEDDAGLAERAEQRPAGTLRDVRVDEQRLGGVADPGPLQLGVEHDRLGGLEVGARVDVHVAVARGGVDHRHGRDALERRLQPLSARAG